jgi:hypothetical protein
MTTKRRRKNRLPPFIPLIKATMATPAWRTMSPGARILNIELRGRLRNDYANNGKLWLSCRDAAKAIGATTQSIVRWFAENEHYGFLRKLTEPETDLASRAREATGACLNVLLEIASDSEAPHSARIKAAKILSQYRSLFARR